MPLAPIATDPQYRHNPYQQFTGFEGLPQVGGPFGQIFMQYLGSRFMAGAGMMPLGLSEQNLYDRLQSLRLQKMHDEFVSQASRRDRETYFEALRGFSQMMGTPWERPQIEAAENLADMMSQAGPTALQVLPPQMLDALGGMRGMNVVMAEYMFQGGRYRIDPVTGRTGLDNDTLGRLNEQMFSSMFSGDAWRRGTGLSAGEAGQLFHELQIAGMGGGGSRMEDMLMQLQGTPVGPGMPRVAGAERTAIYDQAVRMGLDLGMGPGADPRLMGAEPQLRLDELTPDQLDTLRQEPTVAAALESFDNRKAIRAVESYAGVIKAMREIFGDAGYPNAPIPELINSLNQLTGGALPQLSPGEIENMARVTMNLAQNTGLGLEAAMMLSEAATQQAMEMGLPPVFANDALQHSLAFRGAYQGLGMGAHPAWGMSGMEAQMMKDMQLTTAAAGSRLANQMGAALRMSDALAPEGADAFRADSEMAAWLEAVRTGADYYIDPATGERRGLNLSQNEFQRMMVEGANFDLDEATVQRFLGQQAANLEQVQQYDVANVVRRQQRAEFIDMLVDETEYNAQEAIANLELGVGTEVEQRLGNAVSRTAVQEMFDMTPAQRADRDTRNRLMATAVEERLRRAVAGEEEIEGVSPDQARQLLQQFRKDDNFRAAVVEELYGAAEAASRDEFSPFGPMSLQDAMQQFDTRMMNQTARNQAAAQAEAMQQQALSPLGRSGVLRRGIQAVIDAGPDATLPEILAETLGGERGQELADQLNRTGALQELQDKARTFEEASQKYESAETAEERAALLRPLQEAQKAYQDAVAEIANTAQREGFTLGGAVDRDDAARLVLASDYVRNLRRRGDAEPEQLRRALQVERQRRDDFVGMMYADRKTLSRLGDRGLAELEAMTTAQAELDALATLHTGGDMSVLMSEEKPAGMSDKEWASIRRQRNEAMDKIWHAQAYFRDGLSGTKEDYNYLAEKASLTKIMKKAAGDKTYNYISDLGELMELADGDIEDLVERGIITEDEATTIREGQGEYKEFQEKLDRQKADYRRAGADILREGMARMRLGPDATEEEIEKAAGRLTEEELREYYGGAEAYGELVSGLDTESAAGRRRRHAFAELLRDRDALRRRADKEGVAFDEELGGDLSEVFEKLPAGKELEEGEQEPTEVIIKLETGDLQIEISEDTADKLRVDGKGTVDRRRM